MRYLIKAIVILFPVLLYGQSIPSGFICIDSTIGGGAILYKKSYTSGNPDYVQLINLSKGGVVKMLSGALVSGGTTSSPKYKRESLNTAWNNFKSDYSTAFSIQNGEFFGNATATAAEFSYPVKDSSGMISHGFGNSEPWVKRKLKLWGQYAEVQSYNNNSTTISTDACPTIIVGADKSAPFNASASVARTFIGVMDGNNDGANEIVLIFSSITSTQAHASTVLQNFGVEPNDMIMLDGGGSGQMLCKNTNYVSQTRLIPQTVGVYVVPPAATPTVPPTTPPVPPTTPTVVPPTTPTVPTVPPTTPTVPTVPPSTPTVPATSVGIHTPSVNPADYNLRVIHFNNPIHENLTVVYETNKAETIDVYVYDLSGRILKKITNVETEKNSFTIRTEDLPKGLYFCKLVTVSKQITLKVIKL